jgi:hypothetical protein
VIIVTASEDIGFDEPIFAVACTASLRPGQSDEAVPLPWSRTGQAQTGFRRPAHAVPSWLLKIRPSQLGRKVGHIPTDKLQLILERLPPDPSADMTNEQSE